MIYNLLRVRYAFALVLLYYCMLCDLPTFCYYFSQPIRSQTKVVIGLSVSSVLVLLYSCTLLNCFYLFFLAAATV